MDAVSVDDDRVLARRPALFPDVGVQVVVPPGEEKTIFCSLFFCGLFFFVYDIVFFVHCLGARG